MSTAISAPRPPSIITAFGERYGMDANKVMEIVQGTVFKPAKNKDGSPGTPLSKEDVAAALIVCNQYELNPFTREIFAFYSKGKLLIVVGVDGWATIVNRQSALDGIEFEEHFNDSGYIYSVTCTIWRKDRKMPIKVTEYTHECKRETIPWNTMPIRMTRNRSFVQCSRLAFSISGIVDEDEAQTIEGYPGGDRIEVSTSWTGEQEADVAELLKTVNWSAQKVSSFRKQYDSRPTEGIDYLRKEVEKLKRVTPRKQQDAPPAAQSEHPPQQDTPPAEEPVQEEKPAASEPEW